MYRQGHTGIVLLALAAVFRVLLPQRPFLALLACGVLVVERLPDKDQNVAWLKHRGTSHSLFSAVLVGVICAGLGWAVGTYGTVPLLEWLDAIGGRGLDELPLDPMTLTQTGFAVGFSGIVLHLLGDVITVSGIQPLLPFSRYSISLLPLRANSEISNVLLFLAGVAAMIITVAVETQIITAGFVP